MTVEQMNATIETVLGRANENTLHVENKNGKLTLNDYNNDMEISENITEAELIQECKNWADSVGHEINAD